MEQSYLDDLCGSTEIVLQKRHPRPRTKNIERSRMKKIIPAGSATRTAAGVMRLGHAVGAAIGNRENLAPQKSSSCSGDRVCCCACRHRCRLATSSRVPGGRHLCVVRSFVACALSPLAIDGTSFRAAGTYVENTDAQITEGAKTGIIIIRTVAIESASFLFAGLNATAGGVLLMFDGSPSGHIHDGWRESRPVFSGGLGSSFLSEGICPDRQAIVYASNHETDCSQAQPD